MLSNKLESQFGLFDIAGPRKASIEFYQRIIEDLLYEDVKTIDYHEKEEYFEVEFNNEYLPKLLINVRMDSISACTRDVIHQTIKYRDQIRND
ncbi:hypothetical protein ACQRC6_01240 [Peptoniphilus sp. SGI.035]|uniref:hypothetical protein n=1 Tax=Peptoniphilus sp. SGI.035 TaxID=3420564 RepID=UPI003D06A688